MTIFTADTITTLFKENLAQAKEVLAKLEVFCHREPNFAGLSGWVFEQTIQHCLAKELQARGLAAPEFKEQGSLGGRTKADLVVGNFAVEIKYAGLFSEDDAERYGRCRQAARAIGLEYLFVSLGENHLPYRDAITNTLGRENVFILQDPDAWSRFVARIASAVIPPAPTPS